MLTLKQSPVAIIGMLLTCSLAEGEPEPGKLIIALCVLVLTVSYVLACTYVNQRKYES
ncbi:MAG: hypothetical protein ACLSCE_04130 [Bacteroides cellulosilyticus]|uniref:Uncharacterized protein n=1 Tax=Bacteroides stercorirosoris TaxID=871324 RepID=A0A1M6ESG0_9BACE|nr:MULTISPECIES: hypothetical protein [Bacteroides]UWZ88852.1 hypothetical protein NWT25_21305 [Bacteroides cellulosilyticus]SHI88417.1 hypothetical protein SAMN05444350_11042 [Bacteroides stercorirosoris]DAN98049.1 MAG TPA: hypothetical protein [Caudoviricetes sp.]